MHQTAIAVYPVVKDFGRIVRPHNYKIEEQRKGNSGDPAIKFQQKKAELILRIIKANRLRNGIQLCNHSTGSAANSHTSSLRNGIQVCNPRLRVILLRALQAVIQPVFKSVGVC